jgi:hypothetical protein
VDQSGNSPYTEFEEEFIEYLHDPRHARQMQERVAGGLLQLIAVQRVISAPVIRSTDHQVNRSYFRDYVLALYVEIGEFLNATSWKPWKFEVEVDQMQIQDEYADILAFLGIGLILLNRLYPNINPDTLAAAYIRKSRINVERAKGNIKGYGMGKNGPINH